MNDKQYLTCQVACMAEAFDFPVLMQVMLSEQEDTSKGTCYRNVLLLQREEASAVIFPYGVVVFWNMESALIGDLQEKIQEYAIRPLDEFETDFYRYQHGCEKSRFTHDSIELFDNEPMTLLAISHALAQSTKLSVFETQAQRTIEETSSIPRKLAQTGSTSLSRKQTAKMRGQLFLTKSEILLKYELLDTPEFIWEYPELQHIYDLGASYLEIKQRTEILSLKLETIHELFEMLADDLKHQHSSKLEWIIIWLIAVEIVIFIVHDILLV